MVSIYADLQDDENVIIDMVQQVQKGKDIIYGVRKERKTDTFFKRFTAQAFYKLMQSVDKDTVYNHAPNPGFGIRQVLDSLWQEASY